MNRIASPVVSGISTAFACIMIVAQVIVCVVLYFPFAIGHGATAIHFYLLIPVTVAAMTAVVPCMFYLVRFVFLERDSRLKLAGVLLAVGTCAINWLALSSNYELSKMFHSKTIYYLVPTSLLIVAVIQGVVPWQAYTIMQKIKASGAPANAT